VKLLIVTQYFWPENFRINELAAALKQRGHDVTILTSIPNYPEGTVHPAYAADPRAFERFAGIEIIRVPQILRGQSKPKLVANYLSFAVSASILGWWRLRGQPFDCVFVFQTSPVTVGIPGGLLAALKRAPMLMWILDCWPETLAAIGVGSGRAAQSAVGMLVKAVYRSADLLLGQSKGFAANVARYGSPAKFRHFPNWVEDVYLAPPPPRRVCYDRPFTILFAGNVGEAQDLPAVVEAAAKLRGRNLQVRIVGDGRDLQTVRAAVNRLDLHDMFEFCGRHPPEAMPNFLADADALLVSLKRDPLFAMTVPGKVQTYLASERPILAMLDGEGAEIVREAGAGVAVPAGDSEALALAIETLMGMTPEQRAELGANGRSYALAHFRLETLLKQLETWILEIGPKASTTSN
jgi:colanic acid biosynthesis glycosyl transferase WcaI